MHLVDCHLWEGSDCTFLRVSLGLVSVRGSMAGYLSQRWGKTWYIRNHHNFRGGEGINGKYPVLTGDILW